MGGMVEKPWSRNNSGGVNLIIEAVSIFGHADANLPSPRKRHLEAIMAKSKKTRAKLLFNPISAEKYHKCI